MTGFLDIGTERLQGNARISRTAKTMDNVEWAEWWFTNWISRNLSYVANRWSLREFQFKLGKILETRGTHTTRDIWMKVEESHSA